MMEMLSSTALLTQVLPPAFVNKAVGPVGHFLRAYGQAPLLCVELAGTAGSELEVALHAAVDPTASQTNRAMAFHTEVASGTSPSLRGSAAGFSAQALSARLRAGRHFVLPLTKRAEETLSADRISVGRARNKDVVLRDGSVSKFHAWFEVDDAGKIRVADAGSKNGTMVKGVRLAPRELAEVEYGEPVVFGSITTIVCEPNVFWEAFHLS